MLYTKGHDLHRVRVHLKAPGRTYALLTRKLPMLSKRLNEISACREMFVQFRDHCGEFEVFEEEMFDCKVLWMEDEGQWNSLGFFVL